MADARVADLTDSGVPDSSDLLYLVDVSAGPPRDRKLTIGALRTALTPSTPTGTRVRHEYLGVTTTDATPTIIPVPFPITALSTAQYVARVVARKLGATTYPAVNPSSSWVLEGSVRTDLDPPLGSLCTLHSGIFKTAQQEDAPTWDVTIVAGPSEYLKVVVTGAAATTIRWFCDLHIIEVSE